MRALKWLLSAALLSAVCLTPRLWLTERPFPTLPALPGLPVLPQWAAAALTGALVLSIVGCAFARVPTRAIALLIASGAVLVLFDINRLQPWFFQYLLMFGALSMVDISSPESPRSKEIVGACAFIVIATYVWSGAQKANLTFATHVFPSLVQPLGDVWRQRLQPFWFAVPALETLVGVLLISRRTRSWGLTGAVVMHVCILLMLGPFGQRLNPIVWPWNVSMAAMAIVLLYRNDQPLLRDASSTPYGKVLIVLLGLMPALSIAGYWERPLSASLYSGRLPDAWIYLTDRGVMRLPDRYTSDNPALVRETPERFRLDIIRWAESAMNVPPYPAPRVYRDLLKRLEEEGVPRADIMLLVRDDPGLTGKSRTYSAVR